MTITPINQAEAIVAPLFDRDISNCDEFRVLQPSLPEQKLQQSWDCCTFDTSASETRIVWDGDLALTEYDSIRLFATIPPCATLSGFAVADGAEIALFRNMPGANAPLEATSEPLKQSDHSTAITRIVFVVENPGEHPMQIKLGWLGLVDSTMEHLIEEAIPTYTVEWTGLLNPNGSPGISKPLYYTQAECEEMKQRFQTEQFRQARRAVEQAAARWAQFEPEKEIRQFIACGEHLYRYARVRDRGRTPFDEGLIDLAIAGYLCDRPEWSRLAARMMLSAAHTPCWYEGIQSEMPGSNWRHVCFLEDHTLSAMATALQFVGDLLTDEAVEKVLDSIEQAWRVVNEKCEEPGYRWHMNQGLVGNRGRLIGALCLYQHGRGESYRLAVEQAYKDHGTIMQGYLNDEGHCFEGPAYFAQYSLTTSIQLWTAYATFHAQSVSEVVPACVCRSAQYVEAMMSSTSDIGYVIPVNNSGPGKRAKLLTLSLAFLGTQCGWKRAFNYLERREIYSEEPNSHGEGGLSLLFLLRHLPDQYPKIVSPLGGLGGCLESGLLTYECRSPAKGKFWFLCERSALAGHYHKDRGSIVLEAYGEILLVDPGVTYYSNPNTTLMAQSSWHNMASVEGLSMVVQADSSQSARLERFEEFPDGVSFSGDMTPLYDARVRKANRSGRLTVNPGEGEIVLRDAWEFAGPERLSLCFQSYSPWTLSGNTARTRRGDVDLVLQTISDEELPLKFRMDDSRIDGELTPVYALIIEAPPSSQSTLITTIQYSHALILHYPPGKMAQRP